MKKIKDKEVIDKINLFKNYIGCTVEYPEIHNKIIKAKFTGISLSENHIETTYFRKKDNLFGDYLSFFSNRNHNSDFLHTKLLLKSTNNITDELAQKLNYNNAEHFKTMSKYYGLTSQNIDVLRSEYYATDYNNNTIDDQIKKGWIKFIK